MIVQPYDRPTETQFSSPLQGFDMAGGGLGFDPSGNFGAIGGDAISRMMPPFAGNDSDESSLAGTIQSLMQQLGALLRQLTGNGCYGNNCGGNEQYFQNASGSSTGDPHLSFNGNTWNSMASQPDLLHSDSIPGGFQISTQVTAPNANGVTYNQQATITTGYGNTSISLANNGTATLTENGAQIPITDGQTLQLGNTMVTRNQDGSLQVVARNRAGGSITTTMRVNGNGVDVNCTAHDVDLGGDLVGGTNDGEPWRRPPMPQPAPIRLPILEPYDGNQDPFRVLE